MNLGNLCNNVLKSSKLSFGVGNKMAYLVNLGSIFLLKLLSDANYLPQITIMCRLQILQ